MKLLLAIVQDADAGKLQRALIEGGYQSTKLASTGGFLREGSTTFLIGLEDHEVDDAKRIIHEVCRERTKVLTSKLSLQEPHEALVTKPTEVTVGGAVVFVLNVEEYTRL